MHHRVSYALFVAVFPFCTHIQAQVNHTPLFDPYTPEPLPASAPSWMRNIARDPSKVSFHEMDSLFNDWMATDINARVKTLDNKPAVNFYRRWMKAYKPYVGADGFIHLPTMDEHLRQLAAHNESAQTTTNTRAGETKAWRNIGPNTTKGKMGKSKDSQACVYRLTVSPTNPDIVYAGTEMGVVFKTTDKGETWLPCNALHNFGGPIFAIQVDPTNPDIVYAGGGQQLWKTTDGGNTWDRHPDINARVNSIRISAANTQYITLSTGISNGQWGGFYVSTDGGQSFTQTLSGVCHDHELQPGNDQRIYLLAKRSGQQKFEMLISDNAGATFTPVSLPVGNITAGRLAVSNAAGGEQYVYAMVNASGNSYDEGPYGGLGKPHILQSTDGGATWTDHTVREGRDQTFSPYMDEPYGGQGYFDMIVGVSESNPEHVIYGLCNAYRSTKGGKESFYKTAIGGYQNQDAMHPDMQDIVVCGNDTWICTDGGVKYSDNFFATPGIDRNFGIYASEYVGFGQGWNEDVMAGGRWHNGDAVITSNFGEGNSLHVGGVEFSTGHVLLSDPNKVYFSDAGVSTIPQNIDGAIQTTYDQFRNKKPFETLYTCKELGFDPRYAQRLIMRSADWNDNDKLYVSEDEGVSFRQMLDFEYEDISSYEFSRSNPNHIYVAGIYWIKHSTDNGNTWEDFETMPFKDITTGNSTVNIAVDPNDENTLWYVNASYPGHVAYTTDCGLTWHYPLNDDAELKKKKYHWIVLTGNQQNGVYLTATEGGVILYKEDGMEQWAHYDNGFPKGARITRLIPFYKESKLRAASSQGIWEIPLYREQFAPIAQPMALNIGGGDISSTPNKTILFDSYSIVNQEQAQWQWSFSPQPQSVIGADTRQPQVVFGKDGAYDVTLSVTTPQGTHSRTIKEMIRINTPTNIETPQTPEVQIRINTTDNQPVMHLQMPNLDESKLLTLHNAKGALLQTIEIEPHVHSIDIPLQGREPGVYIYQLKTGHYKYFGKFIHNNDN